MSIPEQRRDELALKARHLYERSLAQDCDCMEGFIEHHRQRGEADVLRDFLEFLQVQATQRTAQPLDETIQRQLDLTNQLIAEVEGALKTLAS